MELLLKTLLSLSLAGTALGLMLTLVHRFLGKRVSGGFLYAAWLLVLLRFALPVPGLLTLPSPAPIPQATAGSAVPEAPRSYSAEPNPNPGGAYAGEEESLPDAAPAVAEVTARAGTVAPVPDENTRAAFPLWQCLFCVWAAGTVCVAGWNLGGYFRYRRALYRTLIPAREPETRSLNALHPLPWPALWRSGAVSTPLLLGLARPVIVLPDREYTPEMLDNILRHELTHYRRGDLAVKWFAAAVFSVHWFNPLVYLFRREIDRTCELSCDARLLRDMDAHEKQSYGEMLLTLAAEHPLPRRAVAVSFATEKRDLKERLVQIMTFKKKGWTAIVIMLAVTALLAGCAVAMGPVAVRGTQSGEEQTPPVSEQKWEAQVRSWNPETDDSVALPEITSAPGYPIYEVHTVDEFLSALGSERVLLLHAGAYNLTEASDYGGPATKNYSWVEVSDGYELVPNRLERLTIIGEPDADSVSIVTEPRYANVLRFDNCSDVTIQGITAGHSPEQGECIGGVLYFESCDNVAVNGSVLYGCGTVGITAVNCRRVFADSTTVKECSYGAVRANNSYDIRFTNGKIYDCGLKYDGGCYDLLAAITTTGFAVLNTEIYNNSAMLLLNAFNSIGVELRGCDIHGNQFGTVIHIDGEAAVMDGCAIGDNAIVKGWYDDAERSAVDRDGNDLTAEALEAMAWAAYTDEYTGPAEREVPELPYTLRDDGRKEFHVTTADEFLAAIGSDRVIYLDAALFDLSAADNYGGYGGANYYWQADYDGAGLVISGVRYMDIIGLGWSRTNIETLPRYADVLSFVDCANVSIQSLTAGHTKGAGSCSGDVLSFRNCAGCTVLSCGLFGCGVNGINAYGCWNLTIQESVIYECSGFGAVIRDCDNTVFAGSTIRDCAYNTVWLRGDGDVLWDGKTPEQVPEMFNYGQD